MMTQKAAPALAGALSLMMATATSMMAHAQDAGHPNGPTGIRHVLLASIDGMHAVDYINCSRGISGVNGGEPYCPNLAELGETGIHYLDTSTSKQSDSF